MATTAGTLASSTALVGFGLDSVIEVSSAAAVAWQFTATDHERRERTALRVIAVSFFALAGNESTLAAARRLGEPVAALVFASARNPGGGFRTGARAQEEDIARASALYACLTTVPTFYERHRADRDLRCSNRVIYAPGVPVFRDDTGRFLHHPYHVTMLTAAAPNLHALTGQQPKLVATVPSALRARAHRILAVAAAHGHRRLVLGAWCCGVFGNDPTTVAAAFTAALHECNHFDHIVFAVLDRAPATPTYRTFADQRKAT